MLEEGAKPEIYTEEHDKLLGDCETSWVLFVDGYGKDGKRVYDPVKGKTCHQCRQKTLGHRTRCSECDMVQGQFCGDCLYMRYGENVLEANKNPNWICPPCRGICNCSLCRIKKGWNPTGYLYRKVQNLGFKSVAHYLIQTRRSTSNTEDEVPNSQVSAKKSLIFTDAEESVEPNQNKNDKFDEENMNFEEGSVEPDENKNDQFDEENMNFENSALKSSPKLENKQKVNENDGECNGGMELKNSSNLLLNNCSTPQNKRKKENKLSVTPIPNLTSIAGRLRSRDNISEESNKQSELKNSSDCDSSLTRPDKANKRMVIPSISPDSIAGRLRSRIKL
ncbi:hypothetical protein QJS10_CPB17g02545 [Acorus calamus]|uniref:Zinc-finger domain-containing protein n=1 Tax=Acorus calamus TaxID=4465 RepID=A0AAV9CWK1_ACOCL|nr:hypothetical protein QJS10_CPB17g02545 [Acorus calamus]